MIRRTAIFLIVIVSLAAAILSYDGLIKLALISGINEHLAFLFPVAVDGMLWLGTAEVLHSTLSKRSTTYGWFMTLLGVSLSIAGNVMGATSNGNAAWIHAIPPLLMAVSVEAGLKIIRSRVSAAIVSEEAMAAEMEREAKKTQRHGTRVPAAATPPAPVAVKALEKDTDTTPATVVSKPVVAKPTSKSAAGSDEIEAYKRIIASNQELTVTDQIVCVIREHPEAKNSDLKVAFNFQKNGFSTLCGRARLKLQPTMVTEATETATEAPVSDFKAPAVQLVA